MQSMNNYFYDLPDDLQDMIYKQEHKLKMERVMQSLFDFYDIHRLDDFDARLFLYPEIEKRLDLQRREWCYDCTYLPDDMDEDPFSEPHLLYSVSRISKCKCDEYWDWYWEYYKTVRFKID